MDMQSAFPTNSAFRILRHGLGESPLPLPGRSLGGGVFDVFSATIHDHFLTVRARDESGDIHIITTPVEQIAFDIIISKKTSDEPPREIGFLRDKEIDEEIQKTPKTA